MKITKSKLKQLIKEEFAKMLTEEGFSDRDITDIKAGDYIQVEVSADGFDKTVEIIDPRDFESTNPSHRRTSVKFLAKIEQVAATGAPETPEVSLDPRQKEWLDYIESGGSEPA